MTNFDMQKLCRDTIQYAMHHIVPGLKLTDVREMCEQYMLANGADSFWYWNIGAFVFSGKETTVSVSGKTYRTSDCFLEENDILTIDLSPQSQSVWGDYARTIIIEDGKVIQNLNEIKNTEWKNGLCTEIFLHSMLMKNVTEDMTFQDLFYFINSCILKRGFVNLDFNGYLGHSIETDMRKRKYIEKGNRKKLSDVKMFTLEPHICVPNSNYGYKMENIYFFRDGKIYEL